jgi:YidC/Oxa1 family membrane protein insertase
VDKKNTFIGVLFIALAMVSIFIGQHYSQQAPEVRPQAPRQIASAPPALSGNPEPAFTAATEDRAGATVTTLENSFIQVRFTDLGGAIRNVALKKYPETQDQPEPFIFNQHHNEPMLGILGVPGLNHDTHFSLVSKSASRIAYRAVLEGRIEVIRTYTLPPDKGPETDPYQLHSETTFRNLTDNSVQPVRIALALGTTSPHLALSPNPPHAVVEESARQLAMLETGYSNGSDQKFITRSQLESSGGFFGMGAHDARPFIANSGPIVWAAVKNQFFSAILTPDAPADGLVTRRVKVLPEKLDSDNSAYGITGEAEFNLPALAAHGQTTLGMDLYVGPNEYPRLANDAVFKADQDRVVLSGYFKFFSALLLELMARIHRTLHIDWGLAIVLTTLSMKIATLPFTLLAARSQKRMMKIQPHIQVIKEKHKDNPAKLQAAQMELFKKHKVNPLGSCIPMLIPMPFFIGFFYMLQNAAELRFAPFPLLPWVHDLSAPDTVGMLPLFGNSIPINILPLLFVATSFAQQMVMPQPTMDNAQARMMKFMPLLMLWIYYQYSCALSLYSTINGLFTIGQQLVVNRMKDPVMDLPGAAPAGKSPSGRPMKNVTPGKKNR